jgi:hypothetical protein
LYLARHAAKRNAGKQVIERKKSPGGTIDQLRSRRRAAGGALAFRPASDLALAPHPNPSRPARHMPHTYSQNVIHVVFSTKDRRIMEGRKRGGIRIQGAHPFKLRRDAWIGWSQRGTLRSVRWQHGSVEGPVKKPMRSPIHERMKTRDHFLVMIGGYLPLS